MMNYDTAYELKPHQIAFKQTLNQIYYQLGAYRPTFKIVDQAIVDSEQWYTIRVYHMVCIDEWVRSQDNTKWCQLEDAEPYCTRFDMHEELYTLFALRWSE